VKWHYAFGGLMSGTALLLPLMAVPESLLDSGSPGKALSATAHLNFRIVIPSVLYLHVDAEKVPGTNTRTVAVMSTNRSVSLNANAREPRKPESGVAVILNAAAGRIISQDAECVPDSGDAALFCTVSMP
jgi:hypothetical protein